MRTPRSRSSCSVASVASLFCSSTDSVISSSSRCAGEAGRRAAPSITVCDQVADFLNCTGDRLTATPTSSRPGRGVRAGLAQHPLADRHDQAGLLGERNEVERARSGRAADGSSAAAPRSRRRGRSRRRRSAGSTSSNSSRCSAARRSSSSSRRACSARVHAGLEEAVGAAAVGLGAIEREVGVLQQLVGIAAVLRRQRDADAGRRCTIWWPSIS